MQIRPIHDDASYEAAMSRIDALMDMNDGEGPEAGTEAGDEMDVLVTLAEKYEETRFPIDLPTPVVAVRYALEFRGLDQADLGRILHSRSRASELMSGKMTHLSRGMMVKLHRDLGVPAEVLLRTA